MARSQVLVALLRGVNVGGRSILKMADLRDIAATCGFDDVRTHLQSGNLLFRSSEAASRASNDLRGALERTTGKPIAVAVRTSAQLTEVVARCPFEDTAKVHVTFLVDGATAQRPDVDPDSFGPERFDVRGRETYLYLPDGIGRSRLAQALSKGTRSADGTTRNWRTVTALAELAAGNGG